MTAIARRRLVCAAIGAALAASALHAATDPKVTFTDTRLKNGLRVIVAEDHTAPVFSIAVNYDVGSRNERKGRTGFAHLFEHMMFKGSQNVGPGEHFWLVFNNGGNMNGTTNNDRTLYFETLPANQLDLALFLEADRMRALDITKENLDNQRNAVQEERRLGIDNQPYGHTFEAIDELAYENFAYEHSVIGSMADLNAASVEDVAAFFKTYYAPNNAVVAIVGDVRTPEVMAKLRQQFESIPSQPAPPAVDMTEPSQTAERRLTLDDPLARLTRLDIVFKIPPAKDPDLDAIRVAGSILGSGRSSRLYETIVRQKQLAVQAGSFVDDRRGPACSR
jgi:predicted Zn-dependent peptidase